MTEQTKAIFENPQLLREKLGEYFDTGNKKTIEKYAIVAEKMFEKGNKEKLKRYFDKKSTDFWVVLILGLTIISSLFLNLFGLEILNKISNVVFKVAFYIFLLMLLGHILILSYRGYMNGLLKMILGGCVVLFVFYSVLQFALTYGAFGLILGIGIVIFALLFALLSDLCFLFTKELVIENFAQSLDGAVKNAELGKIKKIFFGSSNEFGVGEGKSLFTVIIVVGIMPIIILFAAAMKDRRAGERILNQIEQLKIIINQEQSQTQNEVQYKIQTQTQENPMENTKTLNKQRAGQILVELCEKNNAEACYELSETYALTDKIKMLELEQKACELGWMQSCFELGLFYKDNNNEQKAYEYFKIACDSDLAWACRELSLMYEFGDFVAQDKVEANLLLNKAIKLYEPKCYKEKNFKICELLGEQYENKVDWVNAIEFYSLACENGLPYTCRLVAQMYEKGENVKQDLAQAKEYYGKYCDLGFEEGCKEYKRLNN